MSDTFLSIVIPAYNEEQRISRSLERLVAHLETKPYAWDIIVADDGSADGTADAVARAAEREPRIRLLSLPHGGKGWAVRHGMLASTARWRFLCDADLSMPPEQIDRFFGADLTPPFDVSIGSREVEGARRYDEPAKRHVIGRVYNRAVRLCVLRGLEDTQCGFKLFPGYAAPLLFGNQRMDGFGFDVEVLFLAKKAGLTIGEVPVDWYYYGGSKVSLIAGARGFLEIAQVRVNQLRGRYRNVKPPARSGDAADRAEVAPRRDPE